jgi:hypothetical protein
VRASRGGNLLEELCRWVDVLRDLHRAPHGLEVLHALMSYILEVSETSEAELRNAVRLTLGRAVEEAVMTGADLLRKEGREEGLQEGLERGRAEGRADLLLRQLHAKFGPPPPNVVTRVRAAALTDLDRYAERVLTAVTIDDLFDD